MEKIKSFGFRKPKSFSYKSIFKRISFLYVFFLFLIFGVLNMGNVFVQVVQSDDRLLAISQRLQDLAVLTYAQDSETSKALFAINSVWNSYNQGENVMQTHKADLILLLNYLQTNKHKLIGLGLNQYADFINFLADTAKFSDDIFDLLGDQDQQTYLILLQNSNEVRPNGGFFGSFIVLKIQGGRFKFHVMDSYYPEYIDPDADLQAPAWTYPFLEDGRIGFLASNKYGFTDMDGANIKKIYENTFPDEQVRGVIFVQSKFFEQLVPSLKQKFWEWQFVNANIDLIRGQDLPLKKAKYLQEINTYLKENSQFLLTKIVQNFNKMKNTDSIKVYLTDISSEFDNYLRTNNFITNYSSDNIYTRDYNNSYSKIDGFVDKFVLIKNNEGKIIKQQDNDVINISDLPDGQYEIHIYYTLNIPKHYESFIHKLEKKYDITMQETQTHIMGLDYKWDNKGVIYMPMDCEILDIKGDMYDTKKFKSPFSHNVMYRITSDKNNSFKIIKISFDKK